MSSARAAATSGRSCSAARRVFFEGNVVTIVECPDRAYCGLHLLLGPQPRTDLVERQIRLLGDECEQPLLMLLERRAGVAGARLCRDATGLGPALDPADRRRGADIEQSCRLPCALAILDDRNHAFPKIIRVSPCHRFPLLEAFGGTESDLHARRNPLLLFRFTSSRKCSSDEDFAPLSDLGPPSDRMRGFCMGALLHLLTAVVGTGRLNSAMQQFGQLSCGLQTNLGG